MASKLARRSTAPAPRRRRTSGTFRRRTGGPSPAAVRNRARTRLLTLGGAGAAVFGFIQSKVNLPGIPGLPDSLTYGTGGLAIGLFTGSETLLNIATGPFFAGLHNIALNGVGDKVGGEEDETAGEFDDVAGGEFDDVAAGDFDDL